MCLFIYIGTLLPAQPIATLDTARLYIKNLAPVLAYNSVKPLNEQQWHWLNTAHEVFMQQHERCVAQLCTTGYLRTYYYSVAGREQEAEESHELILTLGQRFLPKQPIDLRSLAATGGDIAYMRALYGDSLIVINALTGGYLDMMNHYTNQTGDYERFYEMFLQTEKIFQRLPGGLGEMRFYYNSARNFATFGDLMLARKCFEKAKNCKAIDSQALVKEDKTAIAQQVYVMEHLFQPFVAATIDNMTADSLRKVGQVSAAAGLLKKSRQTYKSLAPILALSGNLQPAGLNYMAAGKTCLTEILLNRPESRPLADSAAYFFRLGEDLLRRAEFENETALAVFYKGLSMLFQQNDPAEGTRHLCKGLSQLGYPSADLFDRQPPVFQPRNRIYLLEALYLKGCALLELYGQHPEEPRYLEQALFDFETAAAYWFQVRLVFPTDKGLMNPKAQFPEIFARGAWTAVKLYELFPNKKGYLQRAFNIMEKGKSFALRQAVSGRSSKMPETDNAALRSFIAEETEQLADIRLKEALLTRTDLSEAARKVAQEALSALKKRFFSHLRSAERSKDRELSAYYQKRYDNEVATIEKVAENLEMGEAAIEFELGQDFLVGLVITKKDGAQPFRLPYGLNTLYDKIALSELLLNEESPAYAAAAAELYDLILKQPLALLPKNAQIRYLNIVPDEALWRVSFASIPVSKSPIARLLIEDYALSCPASLTFGVQLRQYTPAGVAADSVGIFVADYGASGGQNPRLGTCYEGLIPIDSLRAACKYVASKAPNAHLFLPAGESDFKKWYKNFGFLVLAMHGCVSETGDPLQYGVLFGGNSGQEDNLLTLGEMNALRFPANKLIFVASCRTAWGNISAAEGRLSFARTLHYANCPAVIAPTANVDVQATGQLLKSFSANFLNRQRADEALQKAQIQCLRSGTPPFYWANLICLGNGSSRLK